MQIYFHRPFCSYLPRVPINLTVTVGTVMENIVSGFCGRLQAALPYFKDIS